MQYAILCYHDETVTSAWTREENDACMARLADVQRPLAQAGRLGPVARLMPTTTATTLRKNGDSPIVLDGPFAETKEQLLGFYVAEFDDLDGAVAFARELSVANPGMGGYEIRPVMLIRERGEPL